MPIPGGMCRADIALTWDANTGWHVSCRYCADMRCQYRVACVVQILRWYEMPISGGMCRADIALTWDANIGWHVSCRYCADMRCQYRMACVVQILRWHEMPISGGMCRADIALTWDANIGWHVSCRYCADMRCQYRVACVVQILRWHEMPISGGMCRADIALTWDANIGWHVSCRYCADMRCQYRVAYVVQILRWHDIACVIRCCRHRGMLDQRSQRWLFADMCQHTRVVSLQMLGRVHTGRRWQDLHRYADTVIYKPLRKKETRSFVNDFIPTCAWTVVVSGVQLLWVYMNEFLSRIKYETGYFSSGQSVQRLLKILFQPGCTYTKQTQCSTIKCSTRHMICCLSTDPSSHMKMPNSWSLHDILLYIVLFFNSGANSVFLRQSRKAKLLWQLYVEMLWNVIQQWQCNILILHMWSAVAQWLQNRILSLKDHESNTGPSCQTLGKFVHSTLL